MRAVVQRVLRADVAVDGRVVGKIDRPGLVVLLGVTHTDGAEQVAWLARKVWGLRILREERSASDVDAPVLVVSQFTLYGDARKAGDRPGRPLRQRSTPSRSTRGSAASSRRWGRAWNAGCSGLRCRCRWSTTVRSPCSWRAPRRS